MKLEEKVVAHGQIPELVLTTLATDPNWQRAVAHREDVPTDVWDHLTGRTGNGTRPTAEATSDAFGRPLDDTRFWWALSKERRAGPIDALIAANLDSSRALELVGKVLDGKYPKKLTVQLAATLITHPKIGRDQRNELAGLADGVARLAWLATVGNPDGTGPTSAQLTEHLADYDSWMPGHRRSHRASRLKWLAATRDELLDAAGTPGAHDSLVTAAAGSPRLLPGARQDRVADVIASDLPTYLYSAMALTGNPMTHPDNVDRLVELSRSTPGTGKVADVAYWRTRRDITHVSVPADQVDDQAALEWLMRRAQPTEDRHRGRPDTAWLLVANPHVPDEKAAELHNGVVHRGRRCVPDWAEALSADMVTRRLDTDVNRRGTSPRADRDSQRELAPLVPHAQPERDLPRSRRQQGWMLDSLTAAGIALTFEEEFGDQPDPWALALSMLDDFDGTIGDLAAVVAATFS